MLGLVKVQAQMRKNMQVLYPKSLHQILLKTMSKKQKKTMHSGPALMEERLSIAR
jgi:hypothetical protein